VGGSDGVEHWAQSYDRAPGDEIKIQTDIAESVASALSVALGQAGRAALTLGGTADSAAQDLILQGRKLIRQSSSADTLRKTVALADAAIARDPSYADAYVEKANALDLFGSNFATSPAEVSDLFSQAEAAANKAVALAPSFGPGHAALSSIAADRLDFSTSLREAHKALALSPNDAGVLLALSQTIGWLGTLAEGLQLANRGIALDPLNPRFYAVKSETLVYLRRYSEAVDAGRKALALAPEYRNAPVFLGDALLLLGRSAQAKAEYQSIGADNPVQSLRLTLLAARIGDRGRAEQLILQNKKQIGAAGSFQYGEVCAQLGDKNRAFAELDNAVTAKDPGLENLKVDPFLDPIRNDPRYAALLRRLNFP
jgi:tetratricopeptide (TPR) repeat protein